MISIEIHFDCTNLMTISKNATRFHGGTWTQGSTTDHEPPSKTCHRSTVRLGFPQRAIMVRPEPGAPYNWQATDPPWARLTQTPTLICSDVLIDFWIDIVIVSWNWIMFPRSVSLAGHEPGSPEQITNSATKVNSNIQTRSLVWYWLHKKSVVCKETVLGGTWTCPEGQGCSCSQALPMYSWV